MHHYILAGRSNSMAKRRRDMERVVAAVSDIHVFADGIENAVRTNNRKDIEHYINDIKVRLAAISEYVEVEKTTS